ncbi:MAG TPA: MFS transporter [Candidatus Binataceae bacterium]|nr:MFS transporter [Candidatus Binataceae bacterium]
MNRKERQSWLIVAALFVTLFLVFGSGYNTASVFFTPVLDHFGWSRAWLSSLQTALALSAALSIPAVGWLLDHVQARAVIGVGIVLVACGFFIAGRAASFDQMLLAYVFLGLGIGIGTLLPCSLVVAKEFTEQRGRALGITMAGTTVGGMVMTLVANSLIQRVGWRAGYIILALPMVLIALPLVMVCVRTKPKNPQPTHQEISTELSGLDVGEALRTRSFWMIAVAQLCFMFAVTGGGLHLIPYLIVIGYDPGRAALILSLTMGFGAIGKIALGYGAERIGSRVALAVNLVLMAIGQLLLLGARNPAMLFGYAAVYGLMSGAPLALVPLLMADSLGLKRFGSLSGLAGLFTTIGAGTGPVFAGFLFDKTASYRTAFELFSLVLIVGGCAALGCVTLQSTAHEASVRAAQA